MAKTVTEMDDDGRIVSHKPTRHQRKSAERLIPWTAGPQTRWQKFVRKAVG
ncbi:hypothetical protein Q0Z83_059880 [Actinoplanes sichuanensis]|uniref:DUF397 domain-containing protein n=1 Tax=Actinoplanes sichuanensis TaxID=512349 RepID=A0ABW4A7I7_9ACTN|nr:hypothetical protein [Actinoplanes sichuanensis]BEL07797.1 hypothetical protein Q0Z83_059880 [Actinoplanes sichuanensis]